MRGAGVRAAGPARTIAALPLCIEALALPTDRPLAVPLSGTVLYIEDEPSSAIVVQALLAGHDGLRLLHAPTGRDGVRAAREQQPDVVLLDMRLPDISGVEVVRELSTELAEGRFRIVLLTGDRLNIDVLKAMSLGAFLYLVKPVSQAALVDAVARALASKAAERR